MRKALAVIGLTAVAITGCTTVHTGPSQEAVKYGYGITESGKWKGCVNPSTIQRNGGTGLGDKYFYYPTGQSTFDFTGGQDAESAPLAAVSKDNVKVTFPGSATFNLDTSCDVLQKFHEKIGLKYNAYMHDDGYSDGWKKMLGLYVGQQLHNALVQEVSNVGYRELYNSDSARQRIQTELNAKIAGQVAKYAGGPYFNNFSITLQKPDIPDNVEQALTAEQVAVAQNEAQKKINEKINTELDSIRNLVKVLGPEGYVLYKAIQDGKITVMPIPMGNPLSIPITQR